MTHLPTSGQPDPTEGTVTAALLQDLLSEASRVAGSAHALLAPMSHSRTALRHALSSRGLIVQIGAPEPPPVALAAVDGGSVRQPLYIADLMVVVAASAEGMTSAGGHALLHDHWCDILSHKADNDRLLSAAMASRELTLIDRLTHDIRILDGSTTSTIVTLHQALNVHDPDIQDRVVDLVTDEVLAAIFSLGSPEHRTNPGRILALPKSDSTRHFLKDYQDAFGLDLPGGDRFMAAQILERGEMLYPRAATEHSRINLSTRKDLPAHVAERAVDLATAVDPIRQAASEGRLVVTYLKPETADTVVKVEMLLPEPLATFTAPDLYGAAIDEARLVARYISDETPGPHMQEPFAQYAVDLAAKTVSVGADALNQSMLASLPAEADSYLSLLTRSYRTSNTRGSDMRPGVAGPGAR